MKNRTPSSKFKNAVLVGVLGLMLGNAQAASVTQDVAFDFTNNLMPTGWDYFYLPYSPGTNVKIQNNQLEIGQVDTYGGIYTAFNPKDVTRLEVQYDGSISDVYWGEFTRALLLNNINDYFLTTGGFASSGMAKYGYGSNTTIFNIEGRTPDGVAATYASQVVNPAIFGTFHMDAVFQNGVISQTITRSDGSLVYSSGSVTAPGF